MKTATLEQFEKLMKVILDKVHEIPSEQLQSVIESGAISDVFDANYDEFDRDAYRKTLGLKPLTPLLIPRGTVAIMPTTTWFVARTHFVRDITENAVVKISDLGKNFTNWFLGKTEGAFSGPTLRFADFGRPSLDAPIIEALGGEGKAEITLTEVFALMQAQGHGQNGRLLTNGYANIFYLHDVFGALRAVSVRWRGDGWRVNAIAVADPSAWNAGSRVFSRNSR